MRYIQKLTKLLLCAVALLATQRFCKVQTDSFAVCKISSALAYNPSWETPPLSDGEQTYIKNILNQPYFYLGKGAQCYVFASEDGNYVVKFFRLSHLLPPFWTSFPLPSPLRPYACAKIKQKEGELERDFLSYKIAFEEMREETGILFVHLNKTNTLHQKIQIFDKLHIAHALDLDQMEFLVQKKADLLYPALEKMVQLEGKEIAQRALSDLVALLVDRCKKGIRDKDPDLNTNFGFIGHTPVQIDVGRYRKEVGAAIGVVDRDELIRITDNLKQWLQGRYPDLAEHLEQEEKQYASHS